MATENFRTIPGYPPYCINARGEVKNRNTGKLLTLHTHSTFRLSVPAGKKVNVSRKKLLVLAGFVPAEPTREEKVARLMALLRRGLSQVECARALGVTARTVRQWLADYKRQHEDSVEQLRVLQLYTRQLKAQKAPATLRRRGLYPARLCHDCKKPTNGNYRCPACLAAWRQKHGVTAGEDSCEEAYGRLCWEEQR